ncbi:MAG: serine hydrolase domain-containing protein [Jatrophihabitantaceae bacterium]
MQSELSPDLVDYYQQWLAYRRWFLRVPGVQVAAAVAGQPVLSAAFGLADESTGTALTEQHLFRIASHSKTFTAVLALQQVAAGRLRLDDPVGTHLAELADTPLARVTVGELLSHGGGVIRDSTDGDFWQLLQDFPDRARLLAIAATESAAVLGRNERFKYSNIAYGLVGLILEAVTGNSYHELVATAITGPLGLADTGPELPLDRLAELATGHSGSPTRPSASRSSRWAPVR